MKHIQFNTANTALLPNIQERVTGDQLISTSVAVKYFAVSGLKNFIQYQTALFYSL